MHICGGLCYIYNWYDTIFTIESRQHIKDQSYQLNIKNKSNQQYLTKLISNYQQMNNSNLIVFTHKESIYCCTYLTDTLLAFATERAVVIWDFTEGMVKTEFISGQKLCPISMKIVNRCDINGLILIVQDKLSKIMVFKILGKGSSLIKINQYVIPEMAFTKICYNQYSYISNHVSSTLLSSIYLIRYPNTIEKRQIESGVIQKIFNVENSKFQFITCLLNYSIGAINYYLVIEEGGGIKQFILTHKQGKQIDIELNTQLILPATKKDQIKFVISVQPADDYKAYLCSRFDKIVVLDLRTITVLSSIKLTQFRLIRQIQTDLNVQIFALTGKKQISLMINQKITVSESLHTNLIVDMDTCEFGVLGVTQQGKIFFLPSI